LKAIIGIIWPNATLYLIFFADRLYHIFREKSGKKTRQFLSGKDVPQILTGKKIDQILTGTKIRNFFPPCRGELAFHARKN